MYSTSPAVEICEFLSSVLVSVNLNVLVPVRHLGFEFILGSGIAKVPDTSPWPFDIILPPKEPPVGVIY